MLRQRGLARLARFRRTDFMHYIRCLRTELLKSLCLHPPIIGNYVGCIGCDDFFHLIYETGLLWASIHIRKCSWLTITTQVRASSLCSFRILTDSSPLMVTTKCLNATHNKKKTHCIHSVTNFPHAHSFSNKVPARCFTIPVSPSS